MPCPVTRKNPSERHAASMLRGHAGHVGPVEQGPDVDQRQLTHIVGFRVGAAVTAGSVRTRYGRMAQLVRAHP